MKLQFKHQQFQTDAAKAVCDVFTGQPFSSNFLIKDSLSGFANAPVQVNKATILENIQKIQRAAQLPVSKKLEGYYNLTVEMETGTGKTYTYIKTMYELHKAYGWSKFIIVVPSIAIREGVCKTFQITEEHFMQEYGKKIRYFVYNSAHLTEIDRFASDHNIHAMIINAQAFNARGKDARRIYLPQDTFRSRKPIDILATTNPILIIDEPQSVEGQHTKERLQEFKPLLTLRYSATHKKDSLYNMVYRLDALDAYNQKLVKKICVKGISVSGTTSGTTATGGYLFLESINVYSDKNPTATVEFEIKRQDKITKIRRSVAENFDFFEASNALEQYRGCKINRIDGRNNSLELTNGVKLFVGEVYGAVYDNDLRRIQIRETILSHFEREKSLWSKQIKVLSLFFVDEVAKYRLYENGQAINGSYADIFEEEYANIVDQILQEQTDEYLPDYLEYLQKNTASEVHNGYFSVDKNKHFIDGKIDAKEKISGDSDAYDLIMRNKERLLNKKEPVRFIFSHSALREGWDNPNVFQICTLRQSNSEIRRRQEVGRGLRLCVNQFGQRMDASQLDSDVHTVNVLTVIASESYANFTERTP